MRRTIWGVLICVLLAVAGCSVSASPGTTVPSTVTSLTGKSPADPSFIAVQPDGRIVCTPETMESVTIRQDGKSVTDGNTSISVLNWPTPERGDSQIILLAESSNGPVWSYRAAIGSADGKLVGVPGGLPALGVNTDSLIIKITAHGNYPLPDELALCRQKPLGS